MPAPLSRLFAMLTVLLVGKVTASVVVGYRDYFPPNFDSDFLLGRERYFWDGYHWAFYTHLVAGPFSLLAGTILLSEAFRQRWPAWHRWIGRAQVVCVLLFLVPSGLWMAWYATTGWLAAAGLGSLAIATAVCITLGLRAVLVRRFADHERWMWRTYLLLCSAVFIRLIGGLASVLHYDELWVYPFSAWASWLVPLAVFEGVQAINGFKFSSHPARPDRITRVC